MASPRNFDSHRPRIAQLDDSLAKLNDLELVACMDSQSRRLIAAHKIDSIPHEATRAVADRWAGRVGLLLEDIDGRLGSSLAAQHGAAWASWVSCSCDELGSLQGLRDEARRLVHTAATERDALMHSEGKDGASSSYSDYSDDDTVSSASDGDDSRTGSSGMSRSD